MRSHKNLDENYDGDNKYTLLELRPRVVQAPSPPNYRENEQPTTPNSAADIMDINETEPAPPQTLEDAIGQIIYLTSANENLGRSQADFLVTELGLWEQIQQHEDQIQEQGEQIEERDEEIHVLEGKVLAQYNHIVHQQGRIGEQSREIRDLKDKIREQEMQIDVLKEKMKHHSVGAYPGHAIGGGIRDELEDMVSGTKRKLDYNNGDDNEDDEQQEDVGVGSYKKAKTFSPGQDNRPYPFI